MEELYGEETVPGPLYVLQPPLNRAGRKAGGKQEAPAPLHHTRKEI